MSALAQLIELHGVPTTVLGLVRLHMEKIQPPRGLWTPFQLGRPLGEPGDAAFQRRVLLQALRLLERPDGPVILEDFPDDPPGWTDREGWQPPFSRPAKPSPSNGSQWQQALAEEMAHLAPYWDKARARFGRTTVGLSAMPPEEWPSFMAAFLDRQLPAGPRPGVVAPALALRFTVDDLKAYYTESAQAVGDAPASRQIDAWFWRDTVAGQLLQALRTVGMASENNALKTVSGRFFVPAPWVSG